MLLVYSRLLYHHWSAQTVWIHGTLSWMKVCAMQTADTRYSAALGTHCYGTLNQSCRMLLIITHTHTLLCAYHDACSTIHIMYHSRYSGCLFRSQQIDMVSMCVQLMFGEPWHMEEHSTLERWCDTAVSATVCSRYRLMHHSRAP